MPVIATLNNLPEMNLDNLENPIAKRAVIFSFLFLSASKTIPASDVILPPLKLAITFLPFILPKFSLLGRQCVELGVMK